MRIYADNLCKAYGENVVLDGFSLSTQEPVVLMGQSGVGKTTLLRILMGLERPDRGRTEAPERLGVVFQEDRLIPQLSVRQNISITAAQPVEAAELEEGLRQIGLEETAMDCPVKQLSGGQRRRAALLRALYSGGQALLLDEPFNGLDEDTLQKAIALTRRLTAGRPTLLVSHDPRVAEWLNWPCVRMLSAKKEGNTA